MDTINKKSFSSPDETANPGDKLTVETVSFGDKKVMKVTAEPGWRWSEHLKSVVKTESCQKDHFVYIISGKLGSKMDDGKEEEFGPGEIGIIPPGHDGWNAGNDPVVWLEIPH